MLHGRCQLFNIGKKENYGDSGASQVVPCGKEPTCQSRLDVRDGGSIHQEDPLEEGTATHSSILVWRILWTEKPGGLQSIVLHRVGHDRSNLAHTWRQ